LNPPAPTADATLARRSAADGPRAATTLHAIVLGQFGVDTRRAMRATAVGMHQPDGRAQLCVGQWLGLMATACARRRSPRPRRPAFGTSRRSGTGPSPRKLTLLRVNEPEQFRSPTPIAPASEEGGSFQKVAFHLQGAVLGSQPAQFIPLDHGQTVMAVPRIQIGLLESVANRLPGTAQITGQLFGRAPALADQAHRFGPELGRVGCGVPGT
jgi:hypothetical protein